MLTSFLDSKQYFIPGSEAKGETRTINDDIIPSSSVNALYSSAKYSDVISSNCRKYSAFTYLKPEKFATFYMKLINLKF